MNPGLATIADFVQQITEAIASAVGVEVMVFDLARNIVAASGQTKEKVGSQYHEGSLTGRLLGTGVPMAARSPGSSPECANCNNFGNCQDVVVAHPIIVEGKIIGSFCLVAVDDNQRQLLLTNEQGLTGFLGWMCRLIGSAISERKIQDEMSILIKRYNTVANSVHEGIIATDKAGKIIHFNRSAVNSLKIEADAVMGRPLSQIFPELQLTARNLVDTEVCYFQKGKKRSFLATIVPVTTEFNKSILGYTISLRNLSEVHSYATKLVAAHSKYSFDDILGTSAGMAQVKEKLNKASLTDSTILIRGESGTGKELFSHAVHNASYRSQGPFVALNCGAIPESLLESELFGYEEGAFTGARRGGKPGKFEFANGGTLFLDEIGDMPLHLQSKLLRVLENHAVERVGGTETIPVNVRIIAATNRELETMVERYEFRGDLYYRLNVIPVFIPSLRERKEDIYLLIEHFLTQYSIKLSKQRQQLDEQVLHLLTNYHWPGNVRELQNTIEYAINMSEPGQLIGMEHLPQRVAAAASLLITDSGSAENRPDSLDNPVQLLELPNLKGLELRAIKEALNKFGNNTTGKKKAARYLGISLTTLYRRLKETEGFAG